MAIKTTFGALPNGARFRRNGSEWRKESFPSGANARYLGTDHRYFSATFKDYQEVTALDAAPKE